MVLRAMGTAQYIRLTATGVSETSSLKNTGKNLGKVERVERGGQ
jgi:hypothetical protein